MDERTRDALDDMLSHGREIMTLVARKDVAQFLDDRVKCLAVKHLLVIIGEAATQVPESRRAQIDLPWRPIVGLRNRLIHAYGEADPDTLVGIVEVEVPRMVEKLEAHQALHR